MLGVLPRAITALQGEKSHCCQQTRLTIWWGVNIFSVAVCKHCFFSSKSSFCAHTLMHFYEAIFSMAVNILACPFTGAQRMCWSGAPTEPLSWFLRLTTFSGRNVNRHILISCWCACLPSGQYKLYQARPGAKGVLCGRGFKLSGSDK